MYGFRNGTFIEFINTIQNKFYEINKINYKTFNNYFQNKYFVRYIQQLFSKFKNR